VAAVGIDEGRIVTIDAYNGLDGTYFLSQAMATVETTVVIYPK
jgi:hypothetical protein